MNPTDQPTGSHHEPLDALIADYVQQVEAGVVPDRAALLTRHPELAEELRDFFADFDRLDRQAGDLRLSHDPNRTTDGAPPAGLLGQVRYFGDYELLEVIAHGGMGVVYKARQTSLNRIVALKMILRGKLATPRDVARFRAEAEAAANLDHPNIVPIYEVGDHEGQQYYAMRFVEGVPLSNKPRGEVRAEAQLLVTIARAVHYAHQRGILHRDIKPSNILLQPSDDRATAMIPAITDFGLAKRLGATGDLTGSGETVGTPRYMAPEQAAARKDLSVAADVYSLGIVLYERLTGTPPFVSDNPLELVRQHCETPPLRPSMQRPGLDRDLETVCLKCLEKEPAKRYVSAEALADDLDRWLRGEPILARPVGQAERMWRWCRRNPVVAGLSGGLAAALIAATAVSVGLTVKARELTAVEHQAREKAEKAEDESLTALARSLVRPLSPRNDEFVTEPEAQALWELAETTDDRLGVRFLQESLRARSDPLTSTQISARAEAASVAAIGLNQDRRNQANQLLIHYLVRPDTDSKQQFALARLALECGDQKLLRDPRIAAALLDACDHHEITTDAYDSITALAPQLEPSQAALLVAAAKQERPEYGLFLSNLKEALIRLPASEIANVTLKLLDSNMHPELQCELVETLFKAAAPPSAAEAEQVAYRLTQALEKTRDAEIQKKIADAMANVIERLPTAKGALLAKLTAGVLAGAMEKAKHPSDLAALGEALSGLAKQLPPAEALRFNDRSCGVLTSALESCDDGQQFRLAGAIIDITSNLQAPDAARWLTKGLEKATYRGARLRLAIGLGTNTKHLSVGQAEETLERAARILAGGLEFAWSGDYDNVIEEKLTTFMRRMSAVHASTVLAQCMREAKALDAQVRLAIILRQVARRLPTGNATRMLGEMLEKATSANAQEWLAQGLAEAMDKLPAAEAAQVAGNAVQALTLALDKAKNAADIHHLANSLLVIGERLPAAQAAQVTKRLVVLLTSALEKATGEDHQELCKGFLQVVGRLPVAEAARVHTQALDKVKDADDKLHFVEGLLATASRLPPADAALMRNLALRVLVQGLEPRQSWPTRAIEVLTEIAPQLRGSELEELADKTFGALITFIKNSPATAGYFPTKEFVAMLARLPDAMAARISFRVVQAFTELDRGVIDGSEMHQYMNPAPAASFSRARVSRLCAATAPTPDNWFNYVDSYLTNASPTEVRLRALAAATALTLASTTPATLLATLPAATVPLACRLNTQDLVELLKFPTCIGESRQVVLKHLGNRYHRTFRNHWDFVEYAKEQGLDLDFTTPPKRPPATMPALVER